MNKTTHRHKFTRRTWLKVPSSWWRCECGVRVREAEALRLEGGR